MNTRETQIEQARRLIATGISEDLKEVLEQQYPELRESEDERIRQGLLFFIKKEREKKHLTWDKIPLDDYEAYLERQKEHKPTNSEKPNWKPSEKQMEALSDACVEASTFKKMDILESLYNDLKKSYS